MARRYFAKHKLLDIRPGAEADSRKMRRPGRDLNPGHGLDRAV